MTNDEALEAYDSIAHICGNPTWENRAARHGLFYGDRETRTLFRFLGDDRYELVTTGRRVDVHVALCLWREHVRQWLLSKTEGVNIHTSKAGATGIWCYNDSGESVMLTDDKPTLDEALVAAARKLWEMKGVLE